MSISYDVQHLDDLKGHHCFYTIRWKHREFFSENMIFSIAQDYFYLYRNRHGQKGRKSSLSSKILAHAHPTVGTPWLSQGVTNLKSFNWVFNIIFVFCYLSLLYGCIAALQCGTSYALFTILNGHKIIYYNLLLKGRSDIIKTH